MLQGNVETALETRVMDQNASAIGAVLDVSSTNETDPSVSTEGLDHLLLVQRFHLIEHVYDALARQLEYYFSPQNLQSDTYLQTLRDLNDGCVPVSILANFTKVKAILASIIGFETVESLQKKSNPKQRFIEEETQRINAILHVVNTCYTYNLQIYSIDTQTGKITSASGASSSNLILAVGFLSLCSPTEEPVDAPKTEGSNTLVLRYVPESVMEDEIRSLLSTISDCPSILSVVPDVPSCWLVVLDTWDRSVLLHVLVQLRAMTYLSCGAPVMTRLQGTNLELYAPAAVLTKKKRKKKKRPKSKKSKASTLSIATTASTASISDPVGENPIPSPLILTQDHFPSLLRRHSELENDEEEDEEDDDDDEEEEDDDDASEESLTKDEREEEPKSSTKMGAQHSDTASTATTTSSNASSGFDTANLSSTQQKTAVLGGYAAAVRRSAPENVCTDSSGIATAEPVVLPPVLSPSSVPKVVVNASVTSNDISPDPVHTMTSSSASAWSIRNRRSFVDVVRVNETTQ